MNLLLPKFKISHSIKLYLIGLLVGGLSFTVGCTRNITQKTGIKLVLPSNMANKSNKVSAQTVMQLGHLIINIRGDGMPSPIFFSWDSHQGQNTPPANFILDVPTGSNRLIQVLAVYDVDGVSAQQFYYGDVTTAVTSDATLDILVSLINDVSAQGEGNIIGRYLTSPGVGPTGKIAIRYTPPGKPTMDVHFTEMFGGFFRVFALQGVKFEYYLPDGSLMFPGPISANPSDSTSNTILVHSQSARFHSPAFFNAQGDSANPTFEPRDASETILGWWGPGATSKLVCYPPTGTAINVNGAFDDNIGTNQIVWGTNTSTDITRTTGGVSGSTDSSGLCVATGTRFVDFLSLDPANMGHNDGAAGFRGPYVTQLDSSGNYRTSFEVDTTGTDLVMGWEYLPGVITTGTNKGIDGSDVFYRILPSSSSFNEGDVREDDGIKCGYLPGFSLLKGFGNTTGGAVTATISSSTSYPVGFAQALSENRVVLALCPYSNNSTGKNYFKSGELYRSYGGGGSTSGGPITHAALVGNLVANNGTCTTVDLALLDSNNQFGDSATNTTGKTVTFTGVSPNVQIFDHCGGNDITNTSISIPSNQNVIRIGIQGSVVGSYSFGTAVTGLTSGSNSFYVAPAAVPTRMQFVNASNSPILALGTGVCTQMKINLLDTLNNTSNVYVATNINLSGTGVSYYSDSGCTSVTSMASVAASTFDTGYFWVKVNTSGWYTLIADIGSYNSNGSYFYPIKLHYGLNVAGSGAPAYLGFTTVGNAPSTCTATTVELRDYLGSPVVATSNMSNIQLNVNGPAQFYANGSCTGGFTNTTTSISGGSSVSPLIYINSPTGVSHYDINYQFSGSQFWGQGNFVF